MKSTRYTIIAWLALGVAVADYAFSLGGERAGILTIVICGMMAACTAEILKALGK